MPTAIYDSSLLTQKRQQMAMRKFKTDLAAAALANPNIVRSLGAGQNGNPSQEAVLDANLGCSPCQLAAQGLDIMGNTRGTGCTCTATNTF